MTTTTNIIAQHTIVSSGQENAILVCGMKELNALIIHAANDIIPAIRNANFDNYLHFLNMMYHYTIVSEAQLREAAVPFVSDELQAFYIDLAKEESGHFLLAKADLKDLGYKVDPATPEIVERYNVHWSDFTPETSLEYLAACAVIENVVGHLEEEGRNLIQRLDVSKRQTRWLRTHFEADVEHGRSSLECAQRHFSEDTYEIMIEGARRDCTLWTELFRTAFEGRIDLPKLDQD